MRLGADDKVNPYIDRLNPYAGDVHLIPRGGLPFLEVQVPTKEKELTPERKLSIGHQIIRMIERLPFEDSKLNRLIYAVLEYIPFEQVLTFVSKALNHLTTYQIQNDVSPVSVILRVFEEHEDTLNLYLLTKKGINFQEYPVMSRMQGINSRLYRDISNIHNSLSFRKNTIKTVTTVGIVLVVGIILFLFGKQILKKIF